MSFTELGRSMRRNARSAAAAALLGSAAPLALITLAAPTVASAQATPDLTGIWESPSEYIDEGLAAGVPIGLGSTSWAPLSAGRPEDQKPPSMAMQKAMMEKAIADDVDIFVAMARMAFKPPYTPAGEAALAARPPRPAGPPNPLAACAPRNSSGFQAFGPTQISQTKNWVMLAAGDGNWRTVFLNGGDAANSLPSYNGYSVGKWQNGSLVVTTTNFLGETMNGWPMSPEAKVTETFTPSADGKKLTVKSVYEDPVMLREPLARMA